MGLDSHSLSILHGPGLSFPIHFTWAWTLIPCPFYMGLDSHSLSHFTWAWTLIPYPFYMGLDSHSLSILHGSGLSFPIPFYMGLDSHSLSILHGSGLSFPVHFTWVWTLIPYPILHGPGLSFPIPFPPTRPEKALGFLWTKDYIYCIYNLCVDVKHQERKTFYTELLVRKTKQKSIRKMCSSKEDGTRTTQIRAVWRRKPSLFFLFSF